MNREQTNLMWIRSKKDGTKHKVHDGSIILFIEDEKNPHNPEFYRYNSLEKLNKDWEDVENE